MTFNVCLLLQVVAESKGAEEYVHLKSLEDEYHYMESTMPNRKGSDDHHHEQQPQQEEGQEGVEGLRPGEFQEGREDLFAQGGVGRGGGGGGGHGEALSAEEEAAAQQAALEAEYAEAYHLYQQKQRQDGEQQEQRSDGTARAGSMRAPSPRPPPPFSDDEAGQAYGFGRSAGAGSGSVGGGRGGGRAMDMQDAFAFAAAMDDGGFDDTFKEGGVCTSASETDAQQLFGETVEIAGEDEEQEREVGVPCCPRSNSNNINNSINSSSHQQHSKGAAYDKSHLFEPLAEPALAFAPPPAADPDPGTDAHKDSGNLTRASSYESLHEID